MHVLGASERLTRPRAHLPLEEIAERLLDDVPLPGEIALAHPTHLDLRQPALRVEPGAVDGRSHALAPARSSRSVMIPEWSSPPRPLTRMALNSSWIAAVAGRGTPRARADSMMRPRSL